MKDIKYFIGLDVHKERTSYCVRDKLGNILTEAETATLYSELEPRLKPYLAYSLIALEASTSYYTLYQTFLKKGYRIKVANTIQLRQLIAKNDKLDAQRLRNAPTRNTPVFLHPRGKDSTSSQHGANAPCAHAGESTL